jgi:PAS domain S-box-containing protein
MTHERILIVEDEEVATIYLQNILEKIGYTVLATVVSGEMAIQQVAETRPDLIVMDIHLAGEMDGIETANQIRIQFDIPVVYLTSYADDSFLQQAQATEPYGYLVKPAQENELHATIKLALYKHKIESKLKEMNKRLEQEIAEHKQTEEALRQSEERYRHMFQAASVSLWEQDIRGIKTALDNLKQQGVSDLPTYLDEHPEFVQKAIHMIKVLDVNNMTIKIYGAKTKEELLGSLDKVSAPEALPHFKEEILAIAEQKPYYENESYARTLQGETINILVRITLPQTPAKFGTMIVSVTDITKRKQAEKELEQHRRHLERLVEERTAELSKTNAELARASRHKDEFLATMSHELRTPLNAILGYAQILKNDGNLTERQREGLETVKSSGEHLLTLINEILDLSKIEAGQMELQAGEFHLPEFLKYIAEITRMRAEQKGLSFEYEPDQNLPVGVRADEKRLREVLLNILGNAVKFTEKGKVSLRVYALREFSELEDIGNTKTQKHKNTKTLRFEVEDTGIGISPEQLEEIFLPFRQVDTQRHSFEGTGLGLAISSKLVEMMGSTLQVKSTLGKGSTFWFEVQLPEVQGVVPKEQSYGRKITGYRGERLTVLVVDDDEHNRAVLLGMLLPLGFKIAEAKNGQECVEKALKLRPDLILLDLKMPVLDGFGATQQIRKFETENSILDTGYSSLDNDTQYPISSIQHPASGIRIPIIAVSASVFEETRKRALNAGFDDFLIKPFQMEQLLEILRANLDIEWIYEDLEETVTRNVQFDQQPVQLVPLPSEVVEDIRNFAKLGMAKQLLVELDYIEQQDTKYTSFVNTLQQLVKNYQFDRIIELLDTKEYEE